MTQQQRKSLVGRKYISFILVALSLITLAACGGGGGGSGGGSGGGTAQNACFTASAGQAFSGKLPGSGSYSAGGTAPAKGSVTIDSAGNFTYIPRAGLRGMDTFSYRFGSSEATATILIGGAVRIMPLGDSITAGVSGNLPQNQQIGYRRKLYNDLDALSARYGIDFVGSQSAEGSATDIVDREHEGHAGWCDDNNPFCSVSGGQNLDDNITGILNGNPPDVILLHIGTNHFSTDASGMNSILDKISTWALSNYPVSLFLARIIPAADGSLDVTGFNNNVQAIAGSRPGVRVFIVDQQSAFAVAGEPNRADASLMADNLHPNQAGYDRMADRWRGSLTASGALPQCP